MKTNKTIFIFMIVSSFFLPLQLCNASYFTMNLKQDSIYTPGNINLTMNLTEEAKIQDNYQFKVSIFITGTLIREQTLKVNINEPVNFELSVPDVFERTEGRCRCELLIAGNFLEAQEVPLLLWPEIKPYKKDAQINSEIWIYDTSGKLLDLFKKMEVKVVDATFKTARDFGKPDIVFVGENTDPNNMRLLENSITTANTEPVIVYLKQKQFPKETKIEVLTDNDLSKTISLMKTTEFTAGLDFRDVTTLINKSQYLKIKKDDNEKTITSFVGEIKKDDSYFYTYICTIQHKNQVTIYCQFPITDGNDPRYAIILKHILNYTEWKINEIKAK